MTRARSFVLRTEFTNRAAADAVAARAAERYERAKVEDGPERDGAPTWRVRVWTREEAGAEQ
jgi:hypothetical protein